MNPPVLPRSLVQRVLLNGSARPLRRIYPRVGILGPSLTAAREHTRGPRSYTAQTLALAPTKRLAGFARSLLVSCRAERPIITIQRISVRGFSNWTHCQYETSSFRTNIESTARSPSIVKTIIDSMREYRCGRYIDTTFESGRHLSLPGPVNLLVTAKFSLWLLWLRNANCVLAVKGS